MKRFIKGIADILFGARPGITEKMVDRVERDLVRAKRVAPEEVTALMVHREMVADKLAAVEATKRRKKKSAAKIVDQNQPYRNAKPKARHRNGK